MIKKILLAMVCLTGCILNCNADHHDKKIIVFQGARLITGDGSAPIENSVFIVENGKFILVGDQGSYIPTDEAEVINLSGKTVIPGLIDTHIHIGYDRYTDVIDEWAQNDPLGRGFFNFGPHNFTRSNILDHLSRLAYSGVVAAWSAGYEFGEAPYAIRDEIIAGEHPNAAQYYPAGPGITTREAIIPDWARQSAFGVSTADEARTAVNRLAKWKVRQIKMWPNNNPVMDVSVSRAVIEEAKKHNIRVGFHPTSAKGSEALIKQGADVFLHPTFVLDKKLLKKHQVYSALTSAGSRMEFYAPFLYPADPLLKDLISPLQLKRLSDRYPNSNADIRKKSKAQWDNQVSVIKQLREAGVTFAMGSDSGGAGRNKPIGWSAHIDMENMVAAGFSPAEVILAATKVAAESLRLDHLGSITPGKEASFVVLDNNPLDDIANTRKINQVYLRGKKVDRTALREKWRNSWPKESL